VSGENMARMELPMFLWIPPDRTIKRNVTINGVDVTDDILSGKFTRSIIGEDMGFEVSLENSGEKYTGAFEIGQIVAFNMDFSNGTTKQFEGKIENIRRNSSSSFELKIVGSHYTTKLLDITVTAEFANAEVSSILTNIIDNYLPGFTYNNVQVTSTNTNVKWNNEPFFDCVTDLMKFSGYDCFIDDYKDFHFFLQESHTNENEAIVWNDNLIELSGFGQDIVDVRNKVIVYGQAGDLPVIHTSQDLDSQSSYEIKERVLTENTATSEDLARDIGDAEIDSIKNPPTKGTARAYWMYQLNPGDMLYVVHPAYDLTNLFRVIKYTFYFPFPDMDVFFSKDLTVSKLFRERVQKSKSMENIVNPYKMLYSYNFTFDDVTNIDSVSSNNITVNNSNLQVNLGTSGTMITLTKNTLIEVSQVHLLVNGTQLTGTENSITYQTEFYISADGTGNWQQITADALTNVISIGTQLRLKIVLNSTFTKIDSIALLFK
jgi:hypothetical protein